MKQVEEYAFAVLDKLRNLPLEVVEPFAKGFFFHNMK